MGRERGVGKVRRDGAKGQRQIRKNWRNPGPAGRGGEGERHARTGHVVCNAAGGPLPRSSDDVTEEMVEQAMGASTLEAGRSPHPDAGRPLLRDGAGIIGYPNETPVFTSRTWRTRPGRQGVRGELHQG